MVGKDKVFTIKAGALMSEAAQIMVHNQVGLEGMDGWAASCAERALEGMNSTHHQSQNTTAVPQQDGRAMWRHFGCRQPTGVW